jgi:hypothetical protein
MLYGDGEVDLGEDGRELGRDGVSRRGESGDVGAGAGG